MIYPEPISGEDFLTRLWDAGILNIKARKLELDVSLDDNIAEFKVTYMMDDRTAQVMIDQLKTTMNDSEDEYKQTVILP